MTDLGGSLFQVHVRQLPVSQELFALLTGSGVVAGVHLMEDELIWIFKCNQR